MANTLTQVHKPAGWLTLTYSMIQVLLKHASYVCPVTALRGRKSLESIWTNLTDLIMKILSPASKQICSFLLLLDHNSRENERKGDQKIAICFYSTNKTMGGNSSFKTIYIRDPGSSGFKILSKIRRHGRAEGEGANGSTGNPGVKHGLLTKDWTSPLVKHNAASLSLMRKHRGSVKCDRDHIARQQQGWDSTRYSNSSPRFNSHHT